MEDTHPNSQEVTLAGIFLVLLNYLHVNDTSFHFIWCLMIICYASWSNALADAKMLMTVLYEAALQIPFS